MRVAVVQLPVQRGARTSTFQAALSAIDAAADKDPAPDLVLLPAFAGVLGALEGDTTLCENVHGQTTAGCGYRARAWGIFVALGMASRGAERPHFTNVLIDRDGDVRLAQHQTCLDASAKQVFGAGSSHGTADILMGRMALLAGDDLLDADAWNAVVESGAQVVLGSACWTAPSAGGKNRQSVRAQIAKQAKRCGLWCAVADVTADSPGTGPSSPGQSTIFDDTGKIVAAADAGSAVTLWSDIPLPERPAAREMVEET